MSVNMGYYPIHYLITATLPNLAGSLLPSGISAASQALHAAVFPQLLEHVPDHVHTDAGAFALQIGYRERSRRTLDCLRDQSLFLAARHLHIAGPPLELLIRFFQGVEQKVDVMPRVVLTLGRELSGVGHQGGFADRRPAARGVPAWSPDGKWIYYTAKIGESVELMRASLDGKEQQLSHTKPGSLNYHPAE
jgi:hypothetical protein